MNSRTSAEPVLSHRGILQRRVEGIKKFRCGNPRFVVAAGLIVYSGGIMPSRAKGIPEGASVVIPRLFCRDPAAEIEFCKTTFGAEEGVRRPGADGKLAHALITIGPAMVMIESEWPSVASRAPSPDGTSPVVLYVYVEDVDDVVKRATTAGAKVLMPLQNQFWGDRTAWIMDPSGHVWTVASRIEETTEEERQQRLARLLTSQGSAGDAGVERPTV